MNDERMARELVSIADDLVFSGRSRSALSREDMYEGMVKRLRSDLRKIDGLVANGDLAGALAVVNKMDRPLEGLRKNLVAMYRQSRTERRPWR